MRLTLIGLLILLFSSCSKDHPSLPFSKLELPVNTDYRDIFITPSGRWLVAGGNGDFGTVMVSMDEGQTWQQASGSIENQVNCLFFTSTDTGFCADSDIMIYRTTDGGLSWTPFYDTAWPLTVNRNLRSIWFTSPEKGFVCGGKNLANGVLYRTENAGGDWEWQEFDHEYRAICFSDSLNGIMCGFGSLLLTSDGGNSFVPGGFEGYYLTAAAVNSNGEYWMSDFNGRIFSSPDKGNSWREKRDGSHWSVGKGQLNTIAVSPAGTIAAAGPRGFLTVSRDNGASWSDYESFGNTDILKIRWISDSKLMAVGKSNYIFVVEGF